MNYLFLSLLFFFSCLKLQAFTVEPSLSIYFYKGSAELSFAGKKSLDSLAQLSKLYPEYHLQVWAYANDLDMQSEQQSLAAQRAQIVLSYLEKKGAKPKEAQLYPIGFYSLYSNSEEETYRQSRVDIFFIPHSPSTLAALYSFFHKTQLQSYEIDPHENQLIFGKKGGSFFFPARSLITFDGQVPEGKVRIELIEAYSFRDMIYNNLQSMAMGSRPLQTGGMVHIAAKDSLGRSLLLDSGKDIEIAFPYRKKMLLSSEYNAAKQGLHEREFPKDMLLFLSNRSINSPMTPILWEPMAEPFVGREPAAELRLNKVDSSYQIQEIKGLFINEFAFLLPQLFPAQAAEKPQCQEPKQFFQNKAVALYSEAEIMQQYKRLDKETKRSYKKRIADLLESNVRSHNTIEKLNAARRDSFEAQTAAYEACMAEYKSYYAQKGARAERFLEFVAAWNQNKALKKARSQAQLALALFTEKDMALRARQLEGMRLDLVEVAQRKGMTNTLKELKIISFQTPLAYKEDLDKFSAKLVSFQDKTLPYRQILDSDYRMLGFYNYYPGDAEYLKLYALYQEALEIPEALKAIDKELRVLIEEMPESLQDYSKKLHNNYMQLRDIEFRLSEEFQKVVKAQARSSRLGWINCDRFWDLPKDAKQNILVKQRVEEYEQTAWYIVFPDYKALLNLHYNAFSEQAIATDVPKHAEAHLIGLRSIPDEGLFLHHSHGSGLQLWMEQSPQFEPTNLQEFDELLKRLGG